MVDYGHLKGKYASDVRGLAVSINLALSDLHAWISKKHKGLDPNSPIAILGPSMDMGVYYYRMGEQHNTAREGWGMDSDALNVVADRFKAMGFPDFNDNEVRMINAQFYSTLGQMYPRRHFVAKHFPGGTTLLETTEQGQVHFDNKAQIANWIGGFDHVLGGQKAAWGVMLSHASYDLNAFPGIDYMPEPSIPDFLTKAVRTANKVDPTASVRQVYSHVPASMNPFVTNYLREAKGYKGVIVGDWYNMRGATDFTQGLIPQLSNALTGGKSAPDNMDVSFLMGVISGVNYMRPVAMAYMNKSFWDNFRKESPNEYNQFDERLNNLIANTYETLKLKGDPPRSPQDIQKLSFEQKVELVGSYAASINSYEVDKKSYFAELEARRQKFPDPKLYETINVQNQVVANDIWNRTGVLTMQFRKCLVDRVSGKHFEDAPLDSQKELVWFNGLMKNPEFRATYSAINWSDVSGVAVNASPHESKPPQAPAESPHLKTIPVHKPTHSSPEPRQKSAQIGIVSVMS